MPDIPVTITRFPRQEFTSVEVPPASLQQISRMTEGMLIMPMDGPAPDGQVISRFMAKVALEAMALRVIDYDGGQDYICDERQLDPLRDHARTGRISKWPVHARKIYDANAQTSSVGGQPEQVVHECDFLMTPWSEWFFVLAVFGLELAINLGGPEIDGYERWLRQNKEISPLYRPERPSLYPIPISKRDIGTLS
jgi:hypothetical protein